MNKLLYMALFSLFVLTGCQDRLVGTWVLQDSPDGQAVGFVLHQDGTAEALEQSAFVYRTWSKSGNLLRLKGLETSGKQRIDVSEEYEIVQLDNAVLTLKTGKRTTTYVRRNP
jgi:hypothetical protein